MYGPHLVLEGYDTPRRKLGSVGHIYRTLDEYPDVIGMTKIMPPHVQKHLGPGNPEWGVSGFVIIAESHIAIHTYPDRNFFALDIFSCKEFGVDEAIAYVVSQFSPARFDHKLFTRGEDYPRDIGESCKVVSADRRRLRKVARGHR